MSRPHIPEIRVGFSDSFCALAMRMVTELKRLMNVRAAQRPAAGTPPAGRLGLVAHPDLPQLDPPAHAAAEVAQQLAEVDALLGGERR